MTERILLGRGFLSWSRYERIGDRYGSVILMDKQPEDYFNCDSKDIKLVQLEEGQQGSLIAVVLETRQSGHIGDLFRGFSPTTPEVGDEIVLGSGNLFYEDTAVGLAQDTREHDWLNPEALYRAHEQLVDLYFEPE